MSVLEAIQTFDVPPPSTVPHKITSTDTGILLELEGEVHDDNSTDERVIIGNVTLHPGSHPRLGRNTFHSGNKIVFLSGVLVIRAEVTWNDQGWGKQKGRIGIVGITDSLFSSIVPHKQGTEHKNFDLGELGTTSDFTFYYVVGGGGGHELHIKSLKIYVAGDKSDFGPFTERDFPTEVISVRKCPRNGCKLVPYQLYTWGCDECRRDGNGDTSMACRYCNYDLCQACYGKPVATTDVVVVVTPTELPVKGREAFYQEACRTRNHKFLGLTFLNEHSFNPLGKLPCMRFLFKLLRKGFSTEFRMCSLEPVLMNGEEKIFDAYVQERMKDAIMKYYMAQSMTKDWTPSANFGPKMMETLEEFSTRNCQMDPDKNGLKMIFLVEKLAGDKLDPQDMATIPSCAENPEFYFGGFISFGVPEKELEKVGASHTIAMWLSKGFHSQYDFTKQNIQKSVAEYAITAFIRVLSQSGWKPQGPIGALTIPNNVRLLPFAFKHCFVELGLVEVGVHKNSFRRVLMMDTKSYKYLVELAESRWDSRKNEIVMSYGRATDCEESRGVSMLPFNRTLLEMSGVPPEDVCTVLDAIAQSAQIATGTRLRLDEFGRITLLPASTLPASVSGIWRHDPYGPDPVMVVSQGIPGTRKAAEVAGLQDTETPPPPEVLPSPMAPAVVHEGSAGDRTETVVRPSIWCTAVFKASNGQPYWNKLQDVAKAFKQPYWSWTNQLEIHSARSRDYTLVACINAVCGPEKERMTVIQNHEFTNGLWFELPAAYLTECLRPAAIDIIFQRIGIQVTHVAQKIGTQMMVKLLENCECLFAPSIECNIVDFKKENRIICCAFTNGVEQDATYVWELWEVGKYENRTTAPQS